MLFRALVAGMLLCASAATAYAEARCTAIRFAPGASSAIVKGIASNDASVHLLHADHPERTNRDNRHSNHRAQ